MTVRIKERFDAVYFGKVIKVISYLLVSGHSSESSMLDNGQNWRMLLDGWYLAPASIANLKGSDSKILIGLIESA